MRNARPSKPFVSIVVPFLNEAEALPETLRVIEENMCRLSIRWEIVFVDDGSNDGSVEILKEMTRSRPGLTVQLVRLSRNFGKEAALTAGLANARGDAIVPLDADLQDPPELIEDMLTVWRDGYDVVYAVRRTRSGESGAKRITAYGFYRLMGRLSNTAIPADTGDFRLMDKRVVKELLELKERSRFMKGLFAWVGFSQKAIYYERRVRRKGQSTWNYWKLWNFAVDGITSFSRIPLQVVSLCGTLVALAALLYGGWLSIRTIVFGVVVPGYASIITAVLVLGGIQLLGIGVLGEYLGRIFEEVKQRPLYIVEDKWVQEGE